MSGSILLIDSGLGGLSILNALQKRLPGEDFIYFADFAYLPYGVRDETELCQRCGDIVNYYLDHHELKSVVLACNTATVAAIQQLRKQFKLPFFGIEPGIKPAASQSAKGIAVLATELTIQSKQLQKLVERFAHGKPIISLETPELVELVESTDLKQKDLVEPIIKSVLDSIEQDFDILLLGCTHFTFLQDSFRKLLGETVELIDTSDAISAWVKEKLGQEGLLNAPTAQRGKLLMHFSRPPEWNEQQKSEKLARLKALHNETLPIDEISVIVI